MNATGRKWNHNLKKHQQLQLAACTDYIAITKLRTKSAKTYCHWNERPPMIEARQGVKTPEGTENHHFSASQRTAGISRLRGRAAAWHQTTGHLHAHWTSWWTALKTEFNKLLLFCQLVAYVDAKAQRKNETMTDYMYARLQRIRRASYKLFDDDVVHWFIQGVRSTSVKPMLAAFHDLRRGSITEFCITPNSWI
ncbi:hypothetical protein HPB51_012712 [Rhipicephalus microplus]|uniref:Tick transposon n=1 Tax=Rhipicephalus microplus TaxID=6941 RepID=A0A9J6EGK8_RHIMP|nr:hypothetical protein HPB51_012712 [Rhipicephalus microplus]